ncbi:SDR family NAD(P)-dependent oxidoreductase [Rubrivirga sp. IMCC43871]|uniref:SDR family NAD(P)-dependent oxidoreductase n=1 Tax=Rubrivirga sp. IMCC43871 TaxID=3391575 RepID=UPI00399011C6
MLFENQVVVITGAGRGIGAAAARAFAEHGAHVVVNDLDEAPAQETADAIVAAGGQALVVAGSVTEDGFPEHLLDRAVDRFGTLHVLVNNAGFTWDGMLHTMTDVQWQAVLDIHATAPFRMVRAAAKHLREPAKAELAAGRPFSQNRCIVNVSSVSGLHGNVGQINYATAKMGVVGLTKTVAKEWGRFGVRCNAVAFGFMDTRMTQSKEAGEVATVDGHAIPQGIPEAMRERATTGNPLGRPGTPQEAAGGILLMASSLAGYVTGHTLEVTGGSGI